MSVRADVRDVLYVEGADVRGADVCMGRSIMYGLWRLILYLDTVDHASVHTVIDDDDSLQFTALTRLSAAR